MTLRTVAAFSALPLFAVSTLAAQAKPAARPAVAVKAAAEAGVTRETLPNGLRVVLVQNRLAPVVTVELNILAGGNETPQGFPGMAHALEHMAFRGCKGMNADQTAAIYARLGGDNNADTQQNITQFYATVPATDVDVALHAQAACMEGIDNADSEWAQERGAITQEVQRDLSSPTYKLITRLNADAFAGTPYAHDALGTKDSFDKTTGAMLREFYDKWYSPSNGILVIVGDVDPMSTMNTVRELFRPDCEAAGTCAPGDHAFTGEERDVHAGQQPVIHDGDHRLSAAGQRQQRLCSGADSGGCVEQPAR